MTDWGQEPKSLAPRSGRDLMQNGIFFSMQSTWPGDIVFLGCIDRPGSGRPRPAPDAPGRVLIRRETNLGHAGVGLYWSPAADPHGTHRYEVRRGSDVLGTAAQGCHFFDHTPDGDAAARYTVRTVDMDNRASDWTTATRLPDEPFVALALGGHFPEAGRDGWSAEYLEATGWQSMTWVPRFSSAAGDHGGTGRQSGGVEGWWETEVDFVSGFKTRGEVIGTDLDSDLAVIKVDVPAEVLAPLPLGDSNLVQVGQTVVAIGNPFGLSGTMNDGDRLWVEPYDRIPP